MESIIKELPIPKEATKMLEEVPAIQELIEPEPNGYGKDVGILIVGVVAAAVLYKLWLKYGKK